MQRDALQTDQSWPLCFTNDGHYRSWLLAAERIPAGESQYCTDCTPQFQALRIKQSRCGFPGTTFHFNAEGLLDGVRPGCRMAPTSAKLQRLRP